MREEAPPPRRRRSRSPLQTGPPASTSRDATPASAMATEEHGVVGIEQGALVVGQEQAIE